MFEGMFDDAEDIQETKEAEAHGALPSYYAKRPPHCAYDMDLPP